VNREVALRMIYITRNNRAIVESISSGKTMIERDGNHTVPGGTIFRDSSGREESICIVFQGRVNPYGDPQDKESISNKCVEIVLTSFLGGRMPVDTAMSRFIASLMKDKVGVALILLFAFVGMSMLIQALGGG
jgi:hypothetical protein